MIKSACYGYYTLIIANKKKQDIVLYPVSLITNRS